LINVLSSIISLSGALILVIVLTSSCGRESDILQPPVIIGFATDKPGVTYRDPETGQRSGFDISLSRWLADFADEPFVPVETDLVVRLREQGLQRTDEGRLDLVISSYTITSQREMEVDFAGPYMETQQGVMVRSDDPRTITNPSQLAGKSVCAEASSTSIRELRQIPGVIVIEETGLLACINSLLAKQIDAVSTDQILLYGYARTNEDLRIEPDVRFGAIQQYGIGIPPEDGTESCELLNSYVSRFISSGVWDTAFEANFGRDLPREQFKPSPRTCVADSEESN